MADNLHSDTVLCNRTYNLLTQLKCIQINLQHSRVATDNLVRLISENAIDMLFLQEPYTILNKIVGIPNKYKIFASGGGRSRAAIVVTNNQIDTLLIKQLSDADTVVLEVITDNVKIILVSMYLDISRHIDDDLIKIEAIIHHAKGAGILIAMDSNARSTTWHDTLTNTRGRSLEEFIMSQHLHILNEESDYTTFRSSRGSSNIDLTIANNQLLRAVVEWEISDQDSCSDHSIIRYAIGHCKGYRSEYHFRDVRYLVQKCNIGKFKANLLRLAENKICETNTKREPADLDNTLCKRVLAENDIETSIDEFYEVLTLACSESFRTHRGSKRTTADKSVPWWTDELTIMRKRLNALRRRYQRTKTDENLRQQRKAKYLEGKARYTATIKKEKISSWKEYCNMTSSTNPWNVVYKLAAGKRKNNTQLTTLRKPDGSLTKDTRETLQHMLENFVPEDKDNDDTEYHTQARLQSLEPVDTDDDKEFTIAEIRNAIENMGDKKAPGEDGITGEIYKSTFETFPGYMTALYNGCLRSGVFPVRWKRTQLIPITKPGKDNCEDVTKFRPISLVNTGGKVLEKVLINRINHHLFSHDLMNRNQYGFTPQRSTIDAAMAVKNFVAEGLAAEVTVLVSLDVKGAFDAAWWPAILNGLKAYDCPKNLYNLATSYFSQRSAILSTNSVRLQREVSKGCPQGSCCGPGFWNIQYNSLLNLDFTRRTKAVAFADDLVLLTRGATIREAENFANLEMSKVSAWSKRNKVVFNEEKSKVMVISRRKRKEANDIKIYLNNKPLEQVTTLKYLGIIIDDKLKFSQHISYVAEKCSKLIFSLSKSAKISWGLKHEALKTIYKGAILPLLLYGAPVWSEAMKYEYNRLKCIRVQRLINIRMAKAFRTTSNEALCIVAGMTPIIIQIEEAVKQHNARVSNGSHSQLFDQEVELKNWPHPADVVKIIEDNGYNEQTIQVYTDGSKNEYGVGSGVAIFVSNELKAQHKFKLDNRCSNNQAEQLAIVKALEIIEGIDIADCNPRTIGIFTDSRITLDSLKNVHNHSYLIEEIRKRISNLERTNWTTKFSWVKAHAGIYGNELADQLAKAAASNTDIAVSFDRIPKSTIYREISEEATQKWQLEWEKSTKGAVTKQFFPNVRDRIKRNININPNFTAMVTGHGKTRAYLHRFKLIESATCPCNKENQTIDHLLHQCTLLQTQRELLKTNVLRSGNWPASKEELITKHLKSFLTFTKSINFEQL